MPDIHWDVGEGADHETIQATSARRSRRSWIALLIAVMLGAGLGVWFRSLPEPAPRPTPAPSPIPTLLPTRVQLILPARLYQAIDQEAQALADGDVETLITLHTPQDKQTIAWQRHNFVAWGRPGNDRRLYTIINYHLRTSTKAWADIRQFRNGRWFRETRFYRWRGDRWLRSEPDPFFWSDQTETIDTRHFHVIYAVEDRDFIRPIINQLEKAQASLCADLDCGATPLTYTLKFNSGVTSNWPLSSDGREIRFASPRAVGVYEDAMPLDDEGLSLIWTLTWTTVVQRTYGLSSVVDERTNSSLFWAISRWATLRAADHPDIEWLSAVKAELPKQPLSLEMIWDHLTPSNYQTVYELAYATSHFIEHEYGTQSIPKLLKALGTAESFSGVIENGLGVPIAEFDRKWQTWVKQNPSS